MDYLLPFNAAFALALVANLFLIPAILRAARRNGWFDRIDHRKAHNGPIPAMGGIGIFLSFAVVGLLVYFIALHGSQTRSFSSWYYGSILLGATLMHVTGVADDFIDIPAVFKLIFQICAALAVVLGGAVIRTIWNPVTSTAIPIGILGVPLTVFWIVAVSNAVNLIDGIDGFAGGVSFFAALTFGLLAIRAGDMLTALVAMSLAGAVAGFLVFNLPPAKIFMGDGGSLFLGFALAVLAIMRSDGSAPLFRPVVPLILLAVPILDTLVAIIRRVRRGLPIHTPDRGHFHHLLLADSGSGTRAVVRAYLLFAALAGAAATYSIVGGAIGVGAGTLALSLLLLSFWRLYHRTAAYSLEARTPHAVEAQPTAVAVDSRSANGGGNGTNGKNGANGTHGSNGAHRARKTPHGRNRPA